jgi:hypothetical protein
MDERSEKKTRKKFVRRGNGELLDAPTLASALDESVFTIRAWRQKGVIPCLRLGYRSYRYKLRDVVAALERRTIKAR